MLEYKPITIPGLGRISTLSLTTEREPQTSQELAQRRILSRIKVAKVPLRFTLPKPKARGEYIAWRSARNNYYALIQGKWTPPKIPDSTTVNNQVKNIEYLALKYRGPTIKRNRVEIAKFEASKRASRSQPAIEIFHKKNDLGEYVASCPSGHEIFVPQYRVAHYIGGWMSCGFAGCSGPLSLVQDHR
jgi:hypothetical protein